MAADLPLKSVCLGLCLLFAAGGWRAAAQVAAKHHVPRKEYRHEVEEAEDQWRSAMTGGNADGLGKLLADDYTGILSTGAIQNRDQAITGLRNGRLELIA